MESVTGQDGRTVLFVSHNMDVISKLCSRAILLNAGEIETAGDVAQVTNQYLNQAANTTGTFTSDQAGRSLRSVSLDEDALRHDKLVIRIGYQFSSKVISPTFGVVVYTETGSPIFGSNNLFHPPPQPIKDQSGTVAVSFERLPLWSGRYHVSVWLSDGWSPIDFQENAISLEFISPSTPLNAPAPKFIGPVHFPANWSIEN